jgi:hypothetical protein
MHLTAMGTLLALQCFDVVFLALHDWIPLGPLNDLTGVRAANPGSKLLVTTLVSFAPYAVGLAGSIVYFGHMYPGWLFWWLWISYALLFAGQMKAWWVPYLLRPDPGRAARYKVMFGTTHSFLPERNGMRVDTLHLVFHVATIGLLIALGVVSVQQS